MLLTYKVPKTDDKLCVCKLQSYLKFKDSKANSVDQAEVTHYELPHLVLCCFQIQLLSYFALSDSVRVKFFIGSDVLFTVLQGIN